MVLCSESEELVRHVIRGHHLCQHLPSPSLSPGNIPQEMAGGHDITLTPPRADLILQRPGEAPSGEDWNVDFVARAVWNPAFGFTATLKTVDILRDRTPRCWFGEFWPRRRPSRPPRCASWRMI